MATAVNESWASECRVVAFAFSKAHKMTCLGDVEFVGDSAWLDDDERVRNWIDDDLWKVFSSWSYEGRAMHDFTLFSTSRFDGCKKIDTFSCQIGWLKHDDRL